MNKYFLSLMSILILFQSFKVADEIFSNKKDQKKGYIILGQDEEEEVAATNDGTEVKEEKIDYESLFTQANLEGGKKIININWSKVIFRIYLHVCWIFLHMHNYYR